MTDTMPVPAAPAPSHIGQATAVEQSRAVAEVMGAIEVALRFPRDMQRALRQMRESCAQVGLAEKAFYRYPKGKDENGRVQNITGPSVHLAKELGRCFGNFQFGMAELRRDDQGAYSEMLAFAWDVENNTRNTNTFVVPHKLDTKRGVKLLTDLRDIYESNTNQASRRMRQTIFALLPPWYVTEAQNLCTKTLKDGGGLSLAQRVSNIVAHFAVLRVRVEDIERKIGRSTDRWDEFDLAQLSIVHGSISRGEVAKDDEFPPMDQVTAAEITGVRKPRKATPPPADGPVEPSPEDIAAMNAEAAATDG